MRRSRVGALVVLVVLATLGGATMAESSEVERQYRIARRLAAESSPQALTALRAVVEAEPDGPWADDALVDEARILGVADWPERTGVLDPLMATPARRVLDRVIGGMPRADRLAEARYLRGLLRLEPLPGYDVAAARLDLLNVATAGGAAEWADRARYALAVLYERSGETERALATYERLLVDDAPGAVGTRALVGAARARLRMGEPGEAAGRLQLAVERDPGNTEADLLRELAVRRLLELRGGDRSGGAVQRFSLGGLRAPCGMAATRDDGLVVADCREGRVVLFDARGRIAQLWEVAGLQGFSADGDGGWFAIDRREIRRLERDGTTVARAALGDVPSVAAFAVDGHGAFWLTDRRGARLARVGPGESRPTVVAEDRTRKIESLVWDGARLVGIDVRTNEIGSFDRAGRWTPLVGAGLERPSWIAADPAGRIAVLDARLGIVLLRDAAGGTLRRYGFAADDITRPLGIALGQTGSLHIIDGPTFEWVRKP